MRSLLRVLVGVALFGAAGLAIGYFVILPQLGQPGEPRNFAGMTGDAKRGKYILTAAGCIACHTDVKQKGKFLAGGPALETPFGTFFAPNITPHKTHGIGGWSLQEFAAALIDGISPKGRHYFPSFPYTSYSGMKSQDIADLKSFLDTVEPVAKPSRPHRMIWPISDRRFVGGWKLLYFRRAEILPLSDKSAVWNRGAYLVNVLGHCGECHTQRDILGGQYGDKHAGNSRGPNGSNVPGIRKLRTASGNPWKKDELIMALQVGMMPSGDFMGDVMAEVVEHSTSKLKPEDLDAIAEYLISLGK